MPPAATAIDLADQATTLLRRIADLPATDAPADTLDTLRSLDTTTAALAAARLAVLGHAQVTAAHELDGAPTLASWLHNRLGIPARQARADVADATGLTELPATVAALRDGRISADHAAAIVATARHDAIAEGADLNELDVELSGTAASTPDVDEFRRTLRARRQAADADANRADADRAARLRTCRLGQRGDGLWELHAVGDQASIETIGTALAAFTVPDPADTPDELKRTYGTRRYDGLVDACKTALDRGAAPTVGGVKPHVGVIIAAEALTDPDTTMGGTAEVTGPVSADMARRLACDAALHRIIMTGSSEPLDVGRATRNWNTAQRRAAIARDRGCRGPACDRPAAWCDLHHIAWWERDHGPTAIANGLLLCHHCHTLVHDRGWRLAFDPTTAEATWTSPRGTVIRTRPKRSQVSQPRTAAA